MVRVSRSVQAGRQVGNYPALDRTASPARTMLCPYLVVMAVVVLVLITALA